MKKNYILLVIALLCCGAFSTSAQNCSSLAITNTTPGSVCGEGSVTLEATSSGTGDAIYWYSAATGGTYLGNGSIFQTPPISTTTSFWATEVIATGMTLPGQGYVYPSTVSSGSNNNQGIMFTLNAQITLIDVEVFSTGAGGSITIELRDVNNSNATIATATAIVPGGGSTASPIPLTVPLNFQIPPGTYRLLKTSATGPPMAYTLAGATNFPYPIGTWGQITSGATATATATTYYYFFNWTVSTGTVTCESSPRSEVIATVNNNADLNVLALPYTHTANTATYFNNYSGAPGTGCGSPDAYLGGNDVVYKYTADNDYILTIELSGLSEAYSGVFIYNNCNDIGDICAAAGSTNTTSGTHSFQVSVTDLEDYYIVVSSKDPTMSMNYTLTINGVTCANYSPPTGSASQNFIDDQTLADLDVTGPNLIWYSDAAATNVIPDNTVLVNNTTYYVTQSFQGCQSPPLAVTVTEVACSTLNVVTTSGSSVCGEGSVTLMAQGAEPAVNTHIYWFATPTGGSRIGVGNQFETPVIDQTTSYWASEVAISGSLNPGQAVVTPTGTLSVATTRQGLVFEVFDSMTIVDVEVYSTGGGGNIAIELYDNSNLVAGNELASVQATLAPGTTTAPTMHKITLNFHVTPGTYRIVRAATAPTVPLRYISGVANFGGYPIPLGVSGQITTGANTFTGAGLSTAYYHFFNWTIFEGAVICESSPRVEVIATVNEVADEMVTGPMPYVHSANTSAYDNNYSGAPGNDCGGTGNFLDGNDVVYQFSPTVGAVYSVQLSNLTSNNAAVFVYESCYDIGSGCYAGAVSAGTTATFGIDEVAMYDGFDYFIVISTSNSPSTGYTLTIDTATINCADYTAAPIGDEDQFMEAGDTLADLDVKGGNLTWYSDAAGTNPIPNTTVLVDGTTYYVRQTLNGCPSGLLAITVTEIVCDDLEILSTTGATIVCKGTTDLNAIGNGGLGTEIYWYSSATAVDPIGTGGTFTTPEITTTTSYWVAEVFLESGSGPSGSVGPVNNSFGAGGGTAAAITTYYMEFDVLQPTELTSVDIFPVAVIGSSSSIEIRDASGNPIINVPYTTTVTGGQTAQTIPLNVSLPTGTGYRMGQVGPISLFRNTAGAVYPYTSSAINIISNNFGPTYYYYFYNWQYGGGVSVLCESPREEVIATVTQDGDILVPATLPYIDANNNTSNYGNTFTGAPGAGCGTTENYLNGHDVVYMFTPTTDDYIDIILSDLTDFYAGLFVYESCGDIGDDCIAGVIAGPSKNDISIEEFPVTAGQTYYIVVSSWLTTSIGYTLEINGFVCANFPAPIGDSPQNFAFGDTLADLDVEGTKPSSTLIWYSDPAGTLVIPDTTQLVDQETYYVRQNFNNCDSPLLAITVNEIDCSDLEIISSTGATAVCLGSLSLSATSSGTGEIYWYDAVTGGNVVGIGSTFQTPLLTSTTSYWAAEVYTDQTGAGGGGLPELLYYKFDTGSTIMNDATTPVGNNPASITGTGLTVGSSGLSGTALVGTGVNSTSGVINTGWNINLSGSFTIGFWTSNIAPSSTLWYIFGDVGAGGFRCFTNGVAGANNWMVRGGGLPDITITGAATMNPNYIHVVYNASAGTYTSYLNGVLNNSVTAPTSNTMSGSGFQVGGYGTNSNLNGLMDEFRIYNRALTVAEIQATVFGPVGGQVLCESPREEVIATVTGDGDVVIPGVPYTTTDNTTLYGNNFTGSPGSDCGATGNYLGGNDVVYQYTPTADDIVKIELTGVSNQNAGLFVYESCGDIGTNCVAGTIRQSGIYQINNFYMTAGQSYYIVISTQTGTTGYTLNINGFVCANLAAPTGDATQYYVGANALEDLTIEEHEHSTGLIWYTDAAGQNPVPANTPLVDGTTYYVSQTVLGCESPLLAVTVEEFQCSDLEIISTTGDLVCQSGSMTLTAQGSGIGNEIYWYSSQSGGNVVGVGNVFETPNLTSTTSYWAEEVFIEGSAPLSGQGKPAPTGTAGFATNLFYGIIFNANQSFSLMSVDVYPNGPGGILTVELWDAGTNNVIASVTVTVPAGTGTTPHTIHLNFQVPAGQAYRLIKTNPTNINLIRDSTGNVYPYPIGTVGEILGGVLNMGSPLGAYYWFYNWTIGDGIILCESPRVEAVAQVNTAIPNAPVGNAVQEFCDEGFTIADLDVTGSNIKWYNSSGSVLAPTTALQDGGKYYASQTINACESNKTEITVTITPKSPKPIGNSNQTFQPGETVADLNVTGQNLTWYSDPQGNNEIPANTQLEDVHTYYVSQTETDLCESELLAITVHRGALGVVDVVFADLQYYPNPVDEVLNITNSHPIDTVEVYSLLGQKVSQQQVGFTNTTVNMSGLASGAYLIKITIDDKIGYYRVIKK